MIELNKKKISEVGELLGVDTSDIKETKFKTVIKKITFPLVQIAFLIASSISGILLGYWERKIQIGYPYTSFTRIYRAGIPTILIIHSGNAVFSTKTHKKFGLSKFQIIPTIIINLILSSISFFMLYRLIRRDPAFGGSVRYGSYKRKKNRVMHSNVFFAKEKSIKSIKCDCK